MTELWRAWESWFVDVEETHSSYPILALLRSPHSNQSWVNSAGVLLDAGSLWVSTIEHTLDPDAQLCIRAGFLSLRWIASTFGIPFDPDPAPDDPLSITRAEFDSAYDEMDEAGLDLKDREQAWTDFSGWRVNDDALVLNLPQFVQAPPIPWVSDRSPIRPEHIFTLRQAAMTRLARSSTRTGRRRRTPAGQRPDTGR